LNATVATGEPDSALCERLKARIRDVPGFPSSGVLFKDITPLLADARAFGDCVAAMAAPWRDAALDAVCGIEARGFIFGAALARALDIGFVPLRKAGKLPASTVGIDFQLEYASTRLEVHADAMAPGARALIVDDVLATGGTLAAATALLERLGAQVAGGAVVIELGFLRGRSQWRTDAPLHALLRY
jgi:adenine phosphoribosyltransferase